MSQRQRVPGFHARGQGARSPENQRAARPPHRSRRLLRSLQTDFARQYRKADLRGYLRLPEAILSSRLLAAIPAPRAFHELGPLPTPIRPNRLMRNARHGRIIRLAQSLLDFSPKPGIILLSCLSALNRLPHENPQKLCGCPILRFRCFREGGLEVIIDPKRESRLGHWPEPVVLLVM